jgi:WhiB family redox-sensing transcriptional regulator
MESEMDTGWMAKGNCRDVPPETMFPSDGNGVIAALEVCAGCPSRQPCLEYAVANRIEHGVWGGASERARRRLAKARRASASLGRASIAGSG